jgi:hypothetical protein
MYFSLFFSSLLSNLGTFFKECIATFPCCFTFWTPQAFWHYYEVYSSINFRLYTTLSLHAWGMYDSRKILGIKCDNFCKQHNPVGIWTSGCEYLPPVLAADLIRKISRSCQLMRDTDSKLQCEEEQTPRRPLLFPINRRNQYDEPGGSDDTSECSRLLMRTVLYVLNWNLQCQEPLTDY